MGNSKETNSETSIIKSKKPKTVPHKDHYARISYLYQASTSLSKNCKLELFSRSYARNMDLVSKKTVLKLNPALKRTICKKCNRLQIPGVNGKLAIENRSKAKASHNDNLIIQCKCGELKRFPVGKDRNYQLFSEKEEVVSDVS